VATSRSAPWPGSKKHPVQVVAGLVGRYGEERSLDHLEQHGCVDIRERQSHDGRESTNVALHDRLLVRCSRVQWLLRAGCCSDFRRASGKGPARPAVRRVSLDLVVAPDLVQLLGLRRRLAGSMAAATAGRVAQRLSSGSSSFCELGFKLRFGGTVWLRRVARLVVRKGKETQVVLDHGPDLGERVWATSPARDPGERGCPYTKHMFSIRSDLTTRKTTGWTGSAGRLGRGRLGSKDVAGRGRCR